MSKTVDYDEASKFFCYDPDTGVLYRLANFQRKGRQSGDPKPCGTPKRYGHLQVSHRGKMYFVHRVAFLLMEKRWPDGVIDHINGKTDDNRWCNLRECSRAENTRHQKLHKRNSSGYRGISYVKSQKRWRAVICVHRKHIYLGQFEALEEAVAARQEASRRLHGEFAGQLSRDMEV